MHSGLYDAPDNQLKPMKDVPYDGVIEKLAEKVDFPRAPDPGDHKAATAKNVESGNVQWGLPLNSDKEQKRRAAAVDVDMKETLELMKEIEDLKTKKEQSKKSQDSQSPEKVTAEQDNQENAIQDNEKGTLNIDE